VGSERQDKLKLVQSWSCVRLEISVAFLAHCLTAMDKISAALSSATGGSNKYWDNQVKLEDIKKLLESPQSEKDNVEGMKHCLVVRLSAIITIIINTLNAKLLD